MCPLIQIWTYQVTAAAWVTLLCPVNGSALKVWFRFTDDLQVCSDLENPNTETTLLLSEGNEFVLPFTGPVCMSADRPLCYAKGSKGNVTVTVLAIMQ